MKKPILDLDVSNVSLPTRLAMVELCRRRWLDTTQDEWDERRFWDDLEAHLRGDSEPPNMADLPERSLIPMARWTQILPMDASPIVRMLRRISNQAVIELHFRDYDVAVLEGML